MRLWRLPVRIGLFFVGRGGGADEHFEGFLKIAFGGGNPVRGSKLRMSPQGALCACCSTHRLDLLSGVMIWWKTVEATLSLLKVGTGATLYSAQCIFVLAREQSAISLS